MKGKNFVSCILCFALTAALFSVSSGWASENEMSLAEENGKQFSLEEECGRAVSALCRSKDDSGEELTAQNEEAGEDTTLVQSAEAEADMASAQTTEAETDMESAQTAAPEEDISSAQIDDFPIIYQMPELPTGCEITALTMAINYYGYPADKTVMASEYLTTASANRYYGADGRLYGTDMNEYFIGDPFTEGGIICGTGAIVTAADGYLADAGSALRAHDITGSSPEELYRRVSSGQPVVVWVTVSMADRRATQGWYTENGDYVDWSTNDHGAVLIGYTDTTVTIADPISGRIEYDREQFEEVFASRGNRCVVLE